MRNSRLKQQSLRLEKSILLQTLAGRTDTRDLFPHPQLQLDLRLDLKSHIIFPFALVVSQRGKGESGGRLSHGCSRRLPPCSLHPDEDLLGAGATQETHLPQTERETGAGDELATPPGPASAMVLGEHRQQMVKLYWLFP